MHIAITGTSGRIGAAVAEQLLERGHVVTGLDLVEPSERLAGVDYIVGDLGELPRSDPRLAGVEAVAHLGALMSWADTDAERLIAANVGATSSLLRALEGSAVQRFVLASTGEVYPENAPAYQPLDEQHPRLPTTWYGVSKVLAEELVEFAGRSFCWSTVSLRFSHTQHPAEILDPGSFFSGPRFFASRRLLRERARGNARVVEQLAPFEGDDSVLMAVRREDGRPVQMGILAASDLAHGVVRALEADTSGHEVIGLGPDDPIDLGEFARELAAAAGLRVVDVTLPVTAPSYVTSNARARDVLGFRPEIDQARFVELAAQTHHERLRMSGRTTARRP